MFDILKAKESFMNYVRQFDLTNDKIHLKLVHTLEVVLIALMIEILIMLN